jgi:thiosulfate dehydrogenase [quinone] large subunit
LRKAQGGTKHGAQRSDGEAPAKFWGLSLGRPPDLAFKGDVVNQQSAHSEDLRKSAGLSNPEIAYLLLRVLFGTNLFLHGVARLIAGHAAFLAYVTKQMQGAPVPAWFLPPFSYVLPWIEGTVGLLLLIGLFTRNVLIVGTLVLLVLQIGSSLAQSWGVVGDQLIYALIFFILLSYIDRNRWSLDAART